MPREARKKARNQKNQKNYESRKTRTKKPQYHGRNSQIQENHLSKNSKSRKSRIKKPEHQGTELKFWKLEVQQQKQTFENFGEIYRNSGIVHDFYSCSY